MLSFLLAPYARVDLLGPTLVLCSKEAVPLSFSIGMETSVLIFYKIIYTLAKYTDAHAHTQFIQLGRALMKPIRKRRES